MTISQLKPDGPDVLIYEVFNTEVNMLPQFAVEYPSEDLYFGTVLSKNETKFDYIFDILKINELT